MNFILFVNKKKDLRTSNEEKSNNGKKFVSGKKEIPLTAWTHFH